MMDAGASYGAQVERGQVLMVLEDGRAQIESFSRPGMTTPPLRAPAGLEPATDDIVYFLLYPDGRGMILAIDPDPLRGDEYGTA